MKPSDVLTPIIKWVLQLRKISSRQQDRLSADQLESDSAEQYLGVLADKVDMNQEHALVAKAAKSIVSSFRQDITSGLREMILPSAQLW